MPVAVVQRPQGKMFDETIRILLLLVKTLRICIVLIPSLRIIVGKICRGDKRMMLSLIIRQSVQILRGSIALSIVEVALRVLGDEVPDVTIYLENPFGNKVS